MAPRTFLSAVFAVALPLAVFGQTQTAQDAKVQSPELKAPERASLVGQLSSTVFGPADLTRGAYTLPSPFEAPQDRGPLLAKVFPSYSPENGVSAWGTGWQDALAITRFRVVGDVAYTAADQLTGPFGRLVKGTDGYWYPLGLAERVRVSWDTAADVLTAYLADGTVMTFGGTAKFAVAGKGTYAWYLTEARTVTGRKTRVDWIATPSGRRFPTSAWWGGVGDDYQYRLDLAYGAIPTPFDDYRPGVPYRLDRRVSTASVLVKHASTGVFTERWRYELAYQPAGYGPGFLLSSVQRIYRSAGDDGRPPPTTYAYSMSYDRFATVAAEQVPKATAILALASDVLRPGESTFFDADQDGMSDLEWSYDFQLLRQTESGFVSEPLTYPPAGTPTSQACRPAPAVYNTPRTLAQLRLGVGDEKHYVVSLIGDASGNTQFTACERDGTAYFRSATERYTQVLSGNWALGPTVRLADVNRDHRPDLVKVGYNLIQVLANVGTTTSFGFAPAATISLSNNLTPDTAWVQDFNGDGMPDVIGRSAQGLTVWYGRGNFQFSTWGPTYTLSTSGGVPLSTSDFALTFADVNKDGLVDVLATHSSGSAAYLFMNTGKGFVQADVPALAAIATTMDDPPVFADISGSGNTEVVWKKDGLLWRIELDGPETGLMTSADDGKGTVLRFGYARAFPTPGGRQRQSVLSSLAIDSSGHGAVTHAYDYGAPTLHGAGLFLVGYDEVQRSNPLGSEWARFLNADAYAGVMSASQTRDAFVPGVEKFTERTHEDATYLGVIWKRLVAEESGWRATDGSDSRSRETRTLAYDPGRELCPARVERTSNAGTLVLDTAYDASLPAFALSLSCLVASTVETGTHADSSLDFRHETAMGRNAVGLVTSVSSLAPGDTWTLQTVTYTPEWLVETVSSPGRGTTTIDHDPSTRLPLRVLTPEGVVVEAFERDPLTDATRALRTTRGTLVHEQRFRYDALERLQYAWDDMGDGTELNPDVSFAYAFATATTPASVRTSTLIDTATLSVRSSVDLLTAAGEPLGSAELIHEGWAFGALTWREPASGRTTSYRRPTIPATLDPASLDHGTLFSGVDELERTVAGPFGVAFENVVRLHADVERRMAESLYLDAGRVIRDTWENGTYRTTSSSDASGDPLAFWDEAGTGWSYVHDTLGRLREVRLPDGVRHRTSYDAHGRVSSVERQDVATVEYDYAPVTGLLAEKRFLSPAGALRRSVTFAYDLAGRIESETHSAPGGATKRFAFHYDGATPESPTSADRLGLLTAVAGEGYVKRFEHRPDGKVSRRTLEIGAWRTVVTDILYDEAGHPRGETVSVYAGASRLLVSSMWDRFDGHGRLEKTTLNGQDLATYAYDGDGLLSQVSFPNGDVLLLSYDDLTRRLTGSTQQTPAFTAAVSQRMNGRGLVQSESIWVGAVSLDRTYRYSAQRFLEEASDVRKGYGYAFDPSGLPTRIVEDGVATDIVRTGNMLVAGELVSTFDDLGRTIQRGDLSLSYGPDGQLARAQRGSRVWTFVHDEAGQRLAKLEGDAHVAAYLDEGYLDAAQLVQPLQIGGRTIAVLRNGAFQTMATDLRGTVLADADGTDRIASPFGDRDVHPALAAAIDYVEKGFDADLEIVRMGVRDYDPKINRFTTPDPLFLEDPTECMSSPAGCNLYTYASADPVLRVDPTGERDYTTDETARRAELQRAAEAQDGFAGWINQSIVKDMLDSHARAVRQAADGEPVVAFPVGEMNQINLGTRKDPYVIGVFTFAPLHAVDPHTWHRMQLQADMESRFVLRPPELQLEPPMRPVLGGTRLNLNRAASDVETHVYAIRFQSQLASGLWKVGVSSAGETSFGVSARAQRQVAALQRRYPGTTFYSDILQRYPARAPGLSYETRVIQRFTRMYGRPPGNPVNR